MIFFKRHGLKILWVSALVLDLFGGLFGLSNKVALFLPAIYFGLSFVLFNRLNIGYRIFHHICIVPLCLYYIIGLFIRGRGVFSSRMLESMLSYSWFDSLSIAYVFFCLMLLTAYAPYFFYKKIRARKNP